MPIRRAYRRKSCRVWTSGGFRCCAEANKCKILRAKMNAHDPHPPQFTLDLTNVPPLLDAKGVRTHIADIGRTLLYHLASTGEIQSVSLGMGKRKPKRMFVTESIAAWISRSAAETKRPEMGAQSAKAASRPSWRKLGTDDRR